VTALPRKAATSQTLRFMRTLWRLVHGLDVRSKRMERDLGVTGPQRLVLRIVGRAPGIGANELARALDVHPSTLTGVVARLEDRGLLKRVTNPHDRRRATFRLTARGLRIDRARVGTVEAAVRRAMARATAAELAATEAVLGRLAVELERADG